MRAVVRPPLDPEERERWREAVAAWRASARVVAGYSGETYADEAFAWSQRCFALFFLNVWDEEWNPRSGDYRTDALLDQIDAEYGGVDVIMLWNGYPRLGLDERDQFAFWRELPGGLDAVRAAVDRCHERGVRCAIPLLPWDRPVAENRDAAIDELCALVARLDLDAVFLDTISSGATEIRTRMDKAKPGVVFIPEVVPDLEEVEHHHLSWMQGAREEELPGILRNKLFEQRHMQFEVRRWTPSHDRELQRAWLNGTGTVIWENVFGTPVGTNDSFRRTLRLIRPIQKRFASLFSSGTWTPVADTLHPNLFASQWDDDGVRLRTLVNRTNRGIAGALFEIAELTDGARVWDLIAGADVTDECQRRSGNGSAVAVHGAVPPEGLGCYLIGQPAALGSDWDEFLGKQAREYGRPPGAARPDGRRDGGAAGVVSPVQVRVVAPPGAARAAAEANHGAIEFVWVDPPRRMMLSMSYRVRECHFADDLDRYHWKDGKHSVRTFNRVVELDPYEISRTPVTNAQYAAFLAETDYRPARPERFLAHWGERSAAGTSPPSEIADHPVTHVTVEDARAFAAWTGGRLPGVEEWQYAAQRDAGRSSPSGCLDTTGIVWELTDNEYTDGHTRFVLIKGGSHYRATGSEWYMDGGPQPSGWIAKMIEFGPAIDRCPTVGFRVARTVAPDRQ